MTLPRKGKGKVAFKYDIHTKIFAKYAADENNNFYGLKRKKSLVKAAMLRETLANS